MTLRERIRVFTLEAEKWDLRWQEILFFFLYFLVSGIDLLFLRMDYFYFYVKNKRIPDATVENIKVDLGWYQTGNTNYFPNVSSYTGVV